MKSHDQGATVQAPGVSIKTGDARPASRLRKSEGIARRWLLPYSQDNPLHGHLQCDYPTPAVVLAISNARGLVQVTRHHRVTHSIVKSHTDMLVLALHKVKQTFDTCWQRGGRSQGQMKESWVL